MTEQELADRARSIVAQAKRHAAAGLELRVFLARRASGDTPVRFLSLPTNHPLLGEVKRQRGVHEIARFNASASVVQVVEALAAAISGEQG